MRKAKCNNAVAKVLCAWRCPVAQALMGCKSTGQGIGESNTAGVKARFNLGTVQTPPPDTLKATVTMPYGAEDSLRGQVLQITKESRSTPRPLWESVVLPAGTVGRTGVPPPHTFIEQLHRARVANLAGRTGRACLPIPINCVPLGGDEGGVQSNVNFPSVQTINA